MIRLCASSSATGIDFQSSCLHCVPSLVESLELVLGHCEEGFGLDPRYSHWFSHGHVLHSCEMDFSSQVSDFKQRDGNAGHGQ